MNFLKDWYRLHYHSCYQKTHHLIFLALTFSEKVLKFSQASFIGIKDVHRLYFEIFSAFSIAQIQCYVRKINFVYYIFYICRFLSRYVQPSKIFCVSSYYPIKEHESNQHQLGMHFTVMSNRFSLLCDGMVTCQIKLRSDGFSTKGNAFGGGSSLLDSNCADRWRG